MDVILTGATGTLGSQILYKLLLKENIDCIHLLVRSKKNKSPESRIQNILSSDYAPKRIYDNIDLYWSKINVYDSDVFLNPSSFLSKDKSYFFIHSAGFVNLSTDRSQRASIFEENYEFTKKIFNIFYSYICKFSYISTAFSIGDVGGLIEDNYHNGVTPKYRNFYEESKHITEKFLLKHGKNSDVKIQILRPSILGGNIGENKKYMISKYMVYYLLGKFFHKSSFNGYSVRIIANFKTGLNVIPVDYVAEIICETFNKNNEQLNIVHPRGTNLMSGINRIIEAVDFNNFSLLDYSINKTLPNDMNKMEGFYYNSIGVHLNPYLISEPHTFSTKVLEKIIPIPEYNLEDYIENTIKYAKTKGFKNERW